MKKLVNLSSESGFGLIHVLAVTMIVSIAVLGLFISIEYARRQADVNYHTRRALLLAQGHIEQIKYNNRNLGSYGRPSLPQYTSTEDLEDDNLRNIMATVNVTSSTGGNPYSEQNGLLQVYRDELWVEVTWQEKETADLGGELPRTYSVKLREDYYWKRSVVNPGL